MPRGKKQCPKCQAEVGPRLRKCECGHEFEFKIGKEPKAQRKASPLALPPVGEPVKRKPPKLHAIENPLEGLTDDPPSIVAVTDRDELKAFIGQLKSAYERSDNNGGGYGAFLHHKSGTLHVNVVLKMRLPD